MVIYVIIHPMSTFPTIINSPTVETLPVCFFTLYSKSLEHFLAQKLLNKYLLKTNEGRYQNTV